MPADRTNDAAAPPLLNRRQAWAIALLLVLSFLLRLSPFLSGDLWFDEVLTIDDYVLQPTLWGVISQYPVANNHVLYSAMLWAWTRAIDPLLYEQLLRLPSALFAATVVALALLHWRRWLGDRAAIACAATFAGSIVFASFAYQLRGYSMSMVLGAILVSGTMEMIAGNLKRGRVLTMIAAVLLPIVLPTNVLLILAHLAFLNLARPRSIAFHAWLRQALVPLAVAGAAGMSYYLLIFDQFMNVIRNAEGWPSGLAVAGNWGLALVAHLGVLGVIFFAQQRWLTKPGKEKDAPEAEDVLLAWKMLLPGLCLFIVMVGALRPAPFPRTFLVFLPTITFAVALACRNSGLLQRARPVVVVLIIGFWSVGWQIVTERMTSVALARAQHPQDLLMQYYRGRTDISEMTALIQAQGAADDIALLTDFHDFSTTRFYWRVRQMPAERVLAAFHNFDDIWRSPDRPEARLVVQATSEAHAREILDDAGQTYSGLQPILTSGMLTLFLVE